MPVLEQLCNIVRNGRHLRTHQLPKRHCELAYDVAVVADPWSWSVLIAVLRRVVHAAEWVTVDHHHAHAASGWLDSPFYHRAHTDEPVVSLVLTYDSFGNDGTLRTFLARAGNATLTPLADWRRGMTGVSYGMAYMEAATAVRDLAWGTPYGSKPPCLYVDDPACELSLPGAFMAYAATGAPRNEWRAGAKLLLHRLSWEPSLWPSPAGGSCDLVDHWDIVRFLGKRRYFACDGVDVDVARQLDREFAATVQDTFEALILAEVRTRLSLVGGRPPSSLVIAGGCALNVKVNSVLARGLDLVTYVPPAPGDNGLALGAAWLAAPPQPTQDAQSIKFAGAPLIFGGLKSPAAMVDLEMTAARWNAAELSSVGVLAKILLSGAIVAVARGRHFCFIASRF